MKRATNFGAFVSVDGIDCLAHIVDLSWTHIKSVEDVLKIGETYDFVVLSADREKNKVSLGYKQLQPHPFVKAMENHPVGSVTKGKVVSVLPFGAFVEIERGIEGLVHVSEVAHNFVKNINEVVKVGDEVEVKVLGIDEPNVEHKGLPGSARRTRKACESARRSGGNNRAAESGKETAEKVKTGKDSGRPQRVERGIQQ